jgi:lipooligosaccharide transport system permease protein
VHGRPASAGFGWASFGIAVAGYAKSIENFNYIVSAVLTPLFLLAGSFPLDNFPEWAQVLANLNPLHHCVVLVRHAVFESWDDLARVGALVAFGALMWRVAIHAMTRKLID